LTLDLPDIGVQKSGSVKDIWNGVTVQEVRTLYTANVKAHGTLLLELGNLTTVGYYDFSDAVTAG